MKTEQICVFRTTSKPRVKICAQKNILNHAHPTPRVDRSKGRGSDVIRFVHGFIVTDRSVLTRTLK